VPRRPVARALEWAAIVGLLGYGAPIAGCGGSGSSETGADGGNPDTSLSDSSSGSGSGSSSGSGSGSGSGSSSGTGSGSSSGTTADSGKDSSPDGGGSCVGCVSDGDCPGAVCAQFGGDTYCAKLCGDAGGCPSGETCTPVNTAEGAAVVACVPPGSCGGSSSGADSGSGSDSGLDASDAGGGSCPHSPCLAGAKELSGCSVCVTTVCTADAYCCNTTWDSMCVSEAASACGLTCSAMDGGVADSGVDSGSGHDAGSGGTVGPGGGTLSALTFAIVGDTRPPSEDDIAGYPTAIITKIWQDIEAASPRPAFAVSTGDYQFASPTHTPGTQAAQIGDYLTARANFSNVVFPAMGNHECDGATADNCYSCGSACSNVGGMCVGGVCVTPNYSEFASKMLTPIAESLPYYTININDTGNAWTSKFVFVACNAWSPTQATWLATQLSTPTTYTFVVRHEGTIATTAPCLSGTGANNADIIMSQHPLTLLIAGHTHTFAYYANEKQVIVGNGGAPLTGSIDYGYVIARQSGASIVFSAYDYATNAVVQTFTVQ
jgi:hypothetical protein